MGIILIYHNHPSELGMPGCPRATWDTPSLCIPWKLRLCGACAGIFAQSTTYPLDIIRRRMQAGWDGCGWLGCLDQDMYPVWWTNSLLWKMAIEIVDFPMKHGGSFHSFWYVHQRVPGMVKYHGCGKSPNQQFITSWVGNIIYTWLIFHSYGGWKKSCTSW